ncbi:MAG TPA: SAM-dependent methyltransferase [Rhodospirillaceae bacterium]|nr:MAG: SAM-dependent methyltransferase [Alphaproteobacteria bacterium GWF2_58_20]HAU28748.1 SAM-dependent methyltransferase [Rhodospirillaceae bacterium]
MKCRHCATPLEHVFLNLGFAPPSNDYLTAEDLHAPEHYFPLKIFICDNCWLAQTEDYSKANEIFRNDYAYFSSTSSGWLAHSAAYADMITKRLDLSGESLVVELASNDGYLLKNFVKSGIPALGIEPTKSTADAAIAIGVPTLMEFFGTELASRLANEGKQADLIIGNNVFAHVPDINDFTAGMKTLLKPSGTITLEFPHFMNLIELCQFDTVYHEHYSYLSLHTVSRVFEQAGLRVFDVEQIPTHGGSLRVYGCHMDDPRLTTQAVRDLVAEEDRRGMRALPLYQAFQERANKVKNDLVAFLIEQTRAGKKVAAYGAAAKGNTILNYGGVKPDLLPFVCDAAPSKQNKFMPGSHIPILPPADLLSAKPDFVLILPWNIAAEVEKQMSAVREWGGKFVVAVPQIRVF